MAFSPVGGAVGDLYLQTLNRQPDLHPCLIVSLRLSYTVSDTIKIYVSRHDVVAFSTLGGTAGDLYLQILEGRSRLYIHVSFTFCVYLILLEVYSTL